MNYWIGVVSRSHVLRGVAGGFAQMSHGKEAPLKRMKAGDGLIYYSPRETYPDGAPLQAFTALGFIRSGEVYEYDMAPDGVSGFVPWRIDVDYQLAQPVPIKQLIAKLEFISDKTHWGAVFRFGQIKISEADFFRIAEEMGCGKMPERVLPIQAALF
ncbi:EVE domain-containing protein [Limnohabitans sp. DCL3]|uniref:EVE domain-containing protein n=1 Tax=Limnohabitans sp. DCL3 TaxID=3374103 RepID=UPI003A8C3B02